MQKRNTTVTYTMTLILASKSPRRKELLAQLGYRFETANADIDESVNPQETPFEYVERMACEKAQAIAKTLATKEVNKKPNKALNSMLVLGSDTCVIVDDTILGQPQDKADCIKQLTGLSNRTHHVLTAVAVCCGSKVKSIVVSTEVTFKPLSLPEIEAYWQTGEPQDKAGSYGIQGIAGQFVKHIKGSYSAVVGLPLYETAQLLAEFNLLTPLQGDQ